MSLIVTLLGTGNPLPDPMRAGPSTLVQGAGTTIVIDCGRGVLQRLAAVGVLPPMLDAVLITHLHSDHLTDLNDVITSHWVMTMQPTPLRIIGPPGITEVVEATLAALAPDIGYRLAHHEDLTWRPLLDITEVDPGDHQAIGAAEVVVGRTNHFPVEPAIGFRITQDGVSVAIAGDSVPCDGLDACCAWAQPATSRPWCATTSSG